MDSEICEILIPRLRQCKQTAEKLSLFSNVVYTTCLDKLGTEVVKPHEEKEKRPNRRQNQKGKLRADQRQLKKRLKEAPENEKQGIQELLCDVKKKILTLSRAENLRKRRKKSRRTREAFYKNPYSFTKSLFIENKSGVLKVPKEELETHLKKTYSDQLRDTPLQACDDIPNIPEPEVDFELSRIQSKEVGDFVKKARAKSAPGRNGISYKLYKNCPGVLAELTKLLQRAWTEKIVPKEWCEADGIYIPKEKDSVGIGNFRPISLLNVEGKIFFGVIAQRMTAYLTANKMIDTSVQKAGIPGFPGCLEHVSMIWSSIMKAKQEKKDLHVVWLDLANAYGSVPHSLIAKALDFFHIPEKVKDLLQMYFGFAVMRFSTKDYTTQWQRLEIGIMMGCVISPLLFVMCMEIILRGARQAASGEILSNGSELPPMKAFMDDVTTLVPSEEETRSLLERIGSLFNRCRMKAKPKKSRSLSLIKGKVKNIHFSINGDTIPTVKEEPVKSLGRWYKFPLTDRHCGKELQATADEGLKTIDKVNLPGKQKVWMFQHGLLPRLLWPLQVYEVTLTRVEAIQRRINKYLRKWLGLPPSFTTLGLYSQTAKLQLPLSSLEEEYKVGKIRLQLMLRDSPDEAIQKAKPEVKSGKKWSASKTISIAEADLRTKEIIGAVNTGREGLGHNPQRWFSKQNAKGTRQMITEEARHLEEEKRQQTAACFVKQCTWTQWDEVEQRIISWQSLLKMEPLRLSFLLRSTYDLLPTATNLKQWGMLDNDICQMCNETRATLEHVLSVCSRSLSRFTWRHNQVLRVLADVTKEQCLPEKTVQTACSADPVMFVKEGVKTLRTTRNRPPRASLLTGHMDWQVRVDLDERLVFPTHIAITNSRPDIVIWSDSGKCVHLVELTVPWEGNIDLANEKKRTKYDQLRMDIEAKGWACKVLPIEVGCRGFLARSMIHYLRGIGLRGRELRQTTRQIESAAESASAWIWQATRPLTSS